MIDEAKLNEKKKELTKVDKKSKKRAKEKNRKINGY